MESRDSLNNSASEPPPTQGWAGVLGAAIAILTLVIPTLAIVYYSSPSSKDSILRTSRPQSSQSQSRPRSRQNLHLSHASPINPLHDFQMQP